jgi:hypothetical protein
MVWMTAPRWLFVPLYLLLGYGALMFVVDLLLAHAVMMTLIIAGGFVYSAGAAVFALKRQNPVPGVFGFHEVFHALTLLAFLCHWSGIFIVAVNPPQVALQPGFATQDGTTRLPAVGWGDLSVSSASGDRAGGRDADPRRDLRPW